MDNLLVHDPIVSDQLRAMFNVAQVSISEKHSDKWDAALPAFNANSAIQRGTISILNLQGGGVIPGASGDLLQFQASLQTLRDQGLPKRAARLKANMFASMYGTDLSKL